VGWICYLYVFYNLGSNQHTRYAWLLSMISEGTYIFIYTTDDNPSFNIIFTMSVIYIVCVSLICIAPADSSSRALFPSETQELFGATPGLSRQLCPGRGPQRQHEGADGRHRFEGRKHPAAGARARDRHGVDDSPGVRQSGRGRGGRREEEK
jgi:hypothetical protein